MLRELMRLEILEHGCEPVLASNGGDAITIIDGDPPVLLLLDLLMPRIDGYAVLHHLRDKGYSFPVIVLSNLSAVEEEQRCRELGAVDFIVKNNIDTDELWERIEIYLPKK